MASPTPPEQTSVQVFADNPMPSLAEVLALLSIPEESVLNVYPYGSHLYGLARPDSGMFPHHPAFVSLSTLYSVYLAQGGREPLLSSTRVSTRIFLKMFPV